MSSMAAMRPMFSGTLLFMVLSACHLLLCTGDSSAEALAQSDFIWDDEDWVVGGEGSVDMTIAHGSRLVKSSDDGKKVWYFAAPTKFLGEKRAAYGGQLKYRLGFFEYDSAGGDLQADYDVVLASEKFGLRIGIKNVVEPWTFNKHYSVLLSESAPWVTLPGGVQRPSKPEFQRLLGSLSALLIRGGYYQGHEDTYIGEVALHAGPDAAQKRRSSVLSSKVLQSTDGSAAEDVGDVVSSVIGRGGVLSVTTKDKLVLREGAHVSVVPLVDVFGVTDGDNGAMHVTGPNSSVVMTLGDLDSYPADELAAFLEQLKVRADAARSQAETPTSEPTSASHKVEL